MILRINFEEVTAVNSAAARLLGPDTGGGVAAPPEALVALEGLVPLDGDLSVETLAEQAGLLHAMDYVLDHLKRRMDAFVIEQYVGSDDAVNAYFDYANVLAVRSRLNGLGREMSDLIELITGDPATDETAEGIGFPD